MKKTLFTLNSSTCT